MSPFTVSRRILGPPGRPMCVRRRCGSIRPVSVISKLVFSEPLTVDHVDVAAEVRRNVDDTLPFTVVNFMLPSLSTRPSAGADAAVDVGGVDVSAGRRDIELAVHRRGVTSEVAPSTVTAPLTVLTADLHAFRHEHLKLDTDVIVVVPRSSIAVRVVAVSSHDDRSPHSAQIRHASVARADFLRLEAHDGRVAPAPMLGRRDFDVVSARRRRR